MRAMLSALFLALPASLYAGEVTVGTATGPVAVASAPQKLVALDMAALDTLSALGVSIAGRPDFAPPAYMASALADVPTVGTLFEPDFEALAALAPDLIVAGGRSQAQVKPLSAVAPTLDMTIGDGDLIVQAEERLAAYGQIFGREDQAAALKTALDTDLAEAREAVKGKGDALIVMTNGGKISVYGAESRFGWMHKALDLPEAHPGLDAGNHGEATSFEFVAETDPDWLLVIDRGAAVGQGGEAAAATLDNPLIKGTKAGKAGQVIYLDAAALYLAGGGVQSLRVTLDEVTKAFAGTGS